MVISSELFAPPRQTVDWQLRSAILDLLRSAKPMTLGDVALVGPGGVRVEQITLTGKDAIRRRLLRLTRYGTWVCDCRTVEDLAEHVDLATLREEPPE